MKKRYALLLIPLILIAGFIAYTWIAVIFSDTYATWRQYAALVLFFVLAVLFIRNFKAAVIATAVYLLLGTFNLLSLMPYVISQSYGMNIGSRELSTPAFQPSALVLLIIFGLLNIDALIEIYLDYKELKAKNAAGKQ